MEKYAMMRAHGIDISYWQQRFEPHTAIGTINFVIQRALYGLQIDALFEAFRPAVMTIPARGLYAYYRTAQNWQSQAESLLNLAEGYHLLALDYETYNNVLTPQSAQDAWNWMTFVQARFSGKVVLYTSPSVYDNYLAPYNNWNAYDLWIAQYWNNPSPDKDPALPRNRQANWTFYQYTAYANAQYYGAGLTATDRIDCNVFNGNTAALWNYLGLVGNPDPPTPPAPAIAYRSRYSLKIRNAPNISAAQVGLLPQGATVQPLEINGPDCWVQIAPAQWVCRARTGQEFLERI